MAATTFLSLAQGVWSLIGVGPVMLQARSSPVWYVISDLPPADGAVGFSLRPDERVKLWTASQIWASTSGTEDSVVVFYPLS